MFRQTQIKLTVLYSVLFLLIFWIFSFGLYIWMDNSFGEGYISQVRERQNDIDTDTFNNQHGKVVTIAGDVALDQLLNILIVLNGALLFIIPITSWFLARQTLAPVQKIHEQQKQFVSDASHEMRTPLSIISGEIEVALNKKRTAEDYKKILVSTKEETDRLARLVENLLFLAKDDQNSQPLQVDAVDVTDIVSSITHALQLKSKQKNISVTLTTKDVASTPTIQGNPSLLRQLFYNLLDNAITYTPKGGEIKILLSETKNTVSVAIQDTGIGIPKEKQDKITNRFYRIDESRSKTRGYGLGLAIVKTIIDRHSGQLLIKSEVKKGSTFTAVFPKA